jgi:CheY-like chemotaxis protein
MNAKVLVMDDEPLVRLMICSRLEQLGAMVCEAGSCTEAIELARNTMFDVAVFDYRLPDGDGLEVVRLLRKEGIGFQVVMLSGEALDIEKDAEQEHGIVAVLSKPPDVDAVVDAVARAAGNQSATEESQVGRYVYWKVDSSNESVPVGPSNAEWLAVDVSALAADEIPSGVWECIQKNRRGLAVLGAQLDLHKRIEALGVEADFVADKEELAALSRRPSTPMERDLLLTSVVQRNRAE